MRQDAVNDGGNADRNKTYFHDNKVNSWGARLGWSQRNFQATLNYNRITKSGRFTMPREWGIEPLFTFLSRERLEGAGDADAVMLNMKKAFPEVRLKTELGYGHYYLPALTHAALNKYAMPSYSHFKLYADYDISPKIKGLNIAAMFISKKELTDQPLTQKNVFNKVEMQLYNIILNYRF